MRLFVCVTRAILILILYIIKVDGPMLKTIKRRTVFMQSSFNLLKYVINYVIASKCYMHGHIYWNEVIADSGCSIMFIYHAVD